MNGLRIIRMEPSDNIGLIEYYTDDWIDRIDHIIWSNLVFFLLYTDDRIDQIDQIDQIIWSNILLYTDNINIENGFWVDFL